MSNDKLATKYKIFAVCAPGLERILVRELAWLGIEGRVIAGGVEFSGDILSVYSTNLWLRTASRILVRIGGFPLTSLKEAPDRFARYPWELYLGNAQGVRVRASCHASRIYHSGAIAERLVMGISKRLGRQVSLLKEKAGRRYPLVFVRLFKDHCQISVDSSGDHLHKRGGKKMMVKAPLRENLAAAMLLASGYDGSQPLVDPFCGSGTILLEAAMISCMIPPGIKRSFAFMSWSNFDPGLWQRILKRSRQFFRPASMPIVGYDKDEDAIFCTISNCEEAGFTQYIRCQRQELDELTPPDGRSGLIVTNPPYGRRLKENNSLLDLYRSFGQIFQERFKGWDMTLILPHDCPAMKRGLKINLNRLSTFSNGGIKVDLLTTRSDKPH